MQLISIFFKTRHASFISSNLLVVLKVSLAPLPALFSIQMEVFVTHTCHIWSQTQNITHIVYICIYQLM